MNKKHRAYLRLHLMSLFFIGVSFISITLAWFAYSGLVTTEAQINVKAWHIEFNKENQVVSNKIVISLDNILPGMQTVSEKINIKNLGDDAATISYDIASARILDETLVNEEHGFLEDKLSHDYPFHVNMSISDTYAEAHDGFQEFEISVSWPLDSNNDKFDSEWGNKAYDFNKQEQLKKNQDVNYQIRPTIKIEITLKATQYLGDSKSSDPNFNLGDIVLYNYQENRKCTEINSNCIKSYIIDKDNKMTDTKVTLLPDLYNNNTEGKFNEYNSKITSMTSNWTVKTKPLMAQDLINIISSDVINSVLVRPNISNEIIGNVSYKNRIDDLLTKTINYNGYYKFQSIKYPYLNTSKCYWTNTEYNKENGFALGKIDGSNLKLYNENKNTTCSIVPIVEISKDKLK